MYGFEYYGWVCKKKCKDEPCFVATTPVKGEVPSFFAQKGGTTGGSPLGTFQDAKRACGSMKPVRTYHSHPSTPGGTGDFGEPSKGDKEAAARRGLAGATMSYKLNGWFYNKNGNPEAGRYPIPFNQVFP
jgi:hypothetical protein